MSIGDATLAIYGPQNTALAHWSLAAVERRNPGGEPAVYAPGPDADELLELSDETMIAAIEKVRRVILRHTPRRGRLRYFLMAGALAAALLGAVFWLPGAMIHHTVKVVPLASRADIGAHLLDTIQRVAGRPCAAEAADDGLKRLARRLLPDRAVNLVVLSRGVSAAEHLPGGYILLNRALIEDFEGPEQVAGFILAEDQRARQVDPLERLLLSTGPLSAFRLLVTGEMDTATLETYAESLLLSPPSPINAATLLARFAAARVSATPYAYALDVSGESVLPLVEGDPIPKDREQEIMSDGEWVALQGICGM